MKYYIAEEAEEITTLHGVYEINITATVNNKKECIRIPFDDFYAWIKCFHFLGYKDKSEPSAMCLYRKIEYIQECKQLNMKYYIEIANKITENYKDYRFENIDFECDAFEDDEEDDDIF